MKIQIRFYLMRTHNPDNELRKQKTRQKRAGQLDHFLSQATFGVTLGSFKIYVDTMANVFCLCWIFKVV